MKLLIMLVDIKVCISHLNLYKVEILYSLLDENSDLGSEKVTPTFFEKQLSLKILQVPSKTFKRKYLLFLKLVSALNIYLGTLSKFPTKFWSICEALVIPRAFEKSLLRKKQKYPNLTKVETSEYIKQKIQKFSFTYFSLN